MVPLDVAVDLTEPLGADTLIYSRIGETEIVCRIIGARTAVGRRIKLHADMNQMHLFDDESGVAL